MSTCLRTGKHRMCSSNSVGRSVSFFVWGSGIVPFRLGCPSPSTGVAIFTVYPDYLIAFSPPLYGAGGRAEGGATFTQEEIKSGAAFMTIGNSAYILFYLFTFYFYFLQNKLQASQKYEKETLFFKVQVLFNRQEVSDVINRSHLYILQHFTL